MTAKNDIYNSKDRLLIAKASLVILAVSIGSFTVVRISVDKIQPIVSILLDKYSLVEFVSYKSSDVIIFGQEYIQVQTENTVQEILVNSDAERFIAVNAKKGQSICLRESFFALPVILDAKHCKK
jgi:hypothetical protein